MLKDQVAIGFARLVAAINAVNTKVENLPASGSVPLVATSDYTVPINTQVLYSAPIDFAEFGLICDGHLIEVE